MYKGVSKELALSKGVALGKGAGEKGASYKGGAGIRDNIVGKEEVFNFVEVVKDNYTKVQGIIGAKEIYSLFIR